MEINHGRTVVGNTMEMGIGVTDIGVTCLFTLMFPFLSSRFFLSTKVCRYNWHSAGSTGWPFSMLKYKYVFQIKRTEAILSNSIYYNFRHTFVHFLGVKIDLPRPGCVFSRLQRPATLSYLARISWCASAPRSCISSLSSLTVQSNDCAASPDAAAGLSLSPVAMPTCSDVHDV